MRAAVIKEFGAEPELVEFEDPRGGDGKIEVEVLVGGLNPVDLLTWSGGFKGPTPPLGSVIGREGVGQAADGRRLYFDRAEAPFGSFAERSLIDPSAAVPVPPDVDPGAAVALGIAGIAGWVGIEWRGGLRAGETVLVLGATGIVGLVAVQAARLLGAGRVIAAGRSEEGLARAAAAGADATVRLEGEAEAMAAAFREAAGGDVDLVLDPLWGEPAMAALLALGAGGRLVQIGNSASTEARVPVAALRPKLAEIRAHGASGVPPEVRREAYATMVSHLEAGELEVESELVPLAEVASAWRRQADSPGRKLAIAPGR
jgi:NADPH:quinone reductase-like Zn-dependent oxidoreductase